MAEPRPSAMPGAWLLEQLRDRTRPDHDAIERSPLLASLFAPGLDRRTYTALLARQYGFYAAIEAPLLGDADRDRAKAGLLAADLYGLGLALHELRSLPICDALPPLCTEAERLGALYVLEGATLGGRVILSRLSDHDDGAIRRACRFYAGYGADTGRRWRHLQHRLCRFAARDPNASDALVTSARTTFQSLRRWLDAADTSSKETH